MKKWPLRWKIAIYAATLGVIATIAGAGTTWIVMRVSEVAVLDHKLAADAREFLRQISESGVPLPESDREFEQKLVPFAWRDRLMELRRENGELIYRSPNLDGSIGYDGIENFHTRRIDHRWLRIAQFHRDNLRLTVAGDLDEIDRIGIDIVLGMFAAIPTVLVVVILGGRWIAQQALAPVTEIRQAAEAITVRNLDRRLPVPPTSDEIAGLISVVNSTLDRLQRSFEQSVRFSADASHQLKTPIAVLRVGIEEILTDPATPQKQQARAEALLHQVHQLTSVAEDLLLLARADAGRLQLEPNRFDLREVIDGVLDDARALAEPQGLMVEADVPSQLPSVIADRRSVSLIAQNLIENAVKYNAAGGRIRVAARAIDHTVELTIANNGEPIPPEHVSYIFDRFYRARTDGRIAGHGLGLSIARELAVANGGALELVSSTEDWTEFRLQLPRG